jgi:hypothetical protein
MSSERSTASGSFEDRSQLRQSVQELRRSGFRDDQIRVSTHLWEDEAGGSNITETDTHMQEWAIIGAVIGAILGGFAVAVAEGTIPGIRTILMGNPWVVILGGAVGCAIAGAILGGLLGLGVPKQEERDYERELQCGRGIVTVKAGDRYQEAEDILHRYGAHDIDWRRTRGTEVQGRSPWDEEDRAA